MSEKSVVKVVTATEAKNRFGEMLKGAYQRAEHLVVERAGIPVAVIVPIQDYERLITEGEARENRANQGRSVSGEEAAARSRLTQFLDKVHRSMPDVPEEEVEQDIQEAIEAVRKGS